MNRRRLVSLLSVLLIGPLGFWLVPCNSSRKALIAVGSPGYESEGAGRPFEAVYSGLDTSRPRINVQLAVMVDGLKQPTDLQFHPTLPHILFVLEKGGKLRWFDGKSNHFGTAAVIEVLTASEQGLLGLAFHPKNPERIYLNYSVDAPGQGDVTRIAEWQLRHSAGKFKAIFKKTLLDVKQPYQNHNAGQLAFGPDGMLYIGLGDGGWGNDPHGNGQNPATMLGSMLRIDVNRTQGSRAYAIPADNPWVNRPGTPPETWAIGLRNPWRYSFTPDGRLVAGDVGQNLYEEITLIGRGQNLGWNIIEGLHCFKKNAGCKRKDLTAPIYEYDRRDGSSVTGGYVYTGSEIADLKGKYVFGDFVSGRLWAIDLPAAGAAGGVQVKKVYTLGKWPLLPSSFGYRKHDGAVFVADYDKGVVYKLVAGN